MSHPCDLNLPATQAAGIEGRCVDRAYHFLPPIQIGAQNLASAYADAAVQGG
jgi:hypothetical protein